MSEIIFIPKEAEERSKKCNYCHKALNYDKDTISRIETLENGNVVGRTDFHLECWKKHFENSVKETARANVNFLFGKVYKRAIELLHPPKKEWPTFKKKKDELP